MILQKYSLVTNIVKYDSRLDTECPNCGYKKLPPLEIPTYEARACKNCGKLIDKNNEIFVIFK